MINGKRLVALCTSRVYEPQTHGYIVRLNELLKDEGISLLIFTINSDIYWEEDRQATEKYVFDLIPYRYIDAVIIMDEKIKSHKIAGKIINNAKAHNLPIVIADGNYEGASCIGYDYDQGFEKVVRHVIEHHHVCRPHIMAGHVGNEFSDKRIEVFRKVIEENGITFEDSMVSHGNFWADPCRIATQALIDRGDMPEAIICANDIMAITVSEMLIKAGFLVPQDVIVTGFDGYDEIYFTNPKITTATCDIIQMANVTAELVTDALRGGAVQNRLIEPTFQANQSCGCPEHNEHPAILRNRFRESFARLNDDNRVLTLITSSMQMSKTPGEMVSQLESYKMDHTFFVVDRRCFEKDINYFTDKHIQDSKKEFVMIYDSEFPEKYKEGTLDLSSREGELFEDVMAPNLCARIMELTKSGYPLIFNALDFMNRPFGFSCFHFNDFLISNYTNTLSVTNAVSIGIGGYINIRYQRTLLKEMDEMYRHDALTGLFNRIGFQNQLKALLKEPEYQDIPVTIIMSDLDGLKYINDNYGHAEGDSAIYQVANALSKSVPESSLSTRFGGDEVFSIVFGECDADAIIKNIDQTLEAYNAVSDKPYTVATSCGYTTAVLDKDFDMNKCIKDADAAMYKAKNEKYAARGQQPSSHH
ncbi:MAG: GGDEF domain-containing protein [Clostridiales bacterium]|nr:GGDEF domain-containing protein [Clostridiales bacterium]